MLGYKVNFKKAKLPSKKILRGKYVALEPIDINRHSKDLYVNFLRDKKNKIWIYLPYGPFRTYGSFKKWLRSFCLGKDPFFYAIYSKRLGFKFEGVFRQMFIIKGKNRDTAWFAIIDKEWKKLKKGYLKFFKISNFDKNYKQIKKLRFE